MGRADSTYGGEVRRGIWWGNPRKGDHLEYRGVDGRIILKWIFEKWDRGYALDRSGSGQKEVAGCCECGNEPSVTIK